MTFEDLGLAPSILRAVAAAGYSTPTPIQAEAIPVSVQGMDVLGSAQTGTGKTAAFSLPVLHRLVEDEQPPRRRAIRALVIAPTRELASQISESIRTYGRFTGLRHTVVYGGVSQVPQTRELHRGVDILIATPGRLLDLMEQGYIDLSAVQVLVLDEADRMMDMGFLPDIRRILAAVPSERQTLFYSATMPREIQRLADSVLTDPVRVDIQPTKANTAKIEQRVYFVPQHHKSKMLDGLLSAEPGARTIVFTRTKHGADSVVERLQKAGFRAEAIHGNKTQNKRQRALSNFKRNRTQVLVATDVAARGIDVDDISHVINYDLPHEPDTYVHRIGRTGRAGASGVAVSFCDHYERKHLRAIERQLGHRLPVVQPDGSLGLPESSASEKPRRPSGGKPPAGKQRFYGSKGKKPSTGGRRPAHASEGEPTQRYKKRKPVSTR